MPPSSANEPVILAKNLSRIYPLGDSSVVGIHQVNLTIGPGELVVLKGNSGSGKSTLLSLLAGLDHPSSGDLVVAGHPLSNHRAADLTRFRREVIGMVFQSFNLLPTLSVLENVCLPALLAEKDLETTRRKAIDLLGWLGLKDRRDHHPDQLSGGEMQRTAIARALINDPVLILADEPTGNLDSRNGTIVVELLAQLNRDAKRTVLIATHSDLADSLATTHIRIKDGVLTDPTCDG
ncbi:MAG: ABC transporter ATP-binding protein [Desulfobacterales bacterium]|jgi:putative ABC transport system ATP-binding protein|nr:ABC transporter ATP-binding protein [Desulfobacterales bacterium]